jgi:hypothetical protein
MPLWISVWSNVSRVAGLEECDADLCNLQCLWNDLVCFFGEVLVGLEDVPVRHLWGSFGCRGMDKAKRYKSSVADSSELDELFVNFLLNAIKSCTWLLGLAKSGIFVALVSAREGSN